MGIIISQLTLQTQQQDSLGQVKGPLHPLAWSSVVCHQLGGLYSGSIYVMPTISTMQHLPAQDIIQQKYIMAAAPSAFVWHLFATSCTFRHAVHGIGHLRIIGPLHPLAHEIN